MRSTEVDFFREIKGPVKRNNTNTARRRIIDFLQCMLRCCLVDNNNDVDSSFDEENFNPNQNKAAAVKFLEYLSSDQAQAYFADGNNEWPAVPTVKLNNPALKAMGSFKPDTLNVGELAKNAAQAQRIFDRAGWR